MNTYTIDVTRVVKETTTRTLKATVQVEGESAFQAEKQAKRLAENGNFDGEFTEIRTTHDSQVTGEYAYAQQPGPKFPLEALELEG